MAYDRNIKAQSKKLGAIDEIYPKSLPETKSSHKNRHTNMLFFLPSERIFPHHSSMKGR